jgi:hypothetical protein
VTVLELDKWILSRQTHTGMELELIGPHPFELAPDNGQQKTRIGTVFPAYRVIYTKPPAVHAWQRAGFIEKLNTDRANQGQPPLTEAEELQVSTESVDLVFEPNTILIRPDPKRMDLSCAADELLQQLVSKRQIRFLSVSDARVRETIKHRGENWRLSAVPKTADAKHNLIFDSRVGIHGQPIYFYNRLTGTRWLTLDGFEKLGALDAGQLASQLQEIAYYSGRRNRMGRPELAFFASDVGHFDGEDIAGTAYEKLGEQELRTKFNALKERFRSTVHESFRKDDSSNKAWAERMLSTLFLDGNETQTEQLLSGLSPEFFLQIEWLPGGRFEEGEFLFDRIFDEAAAHPDDPELQGLCDPRAKGIIFNLIREYGDIDYINVGCVRESLSLNRPQRLGRRGVYIVEFKSRTDPKPLRRIVRLQKWGVWEHLDAGKDMLSALQDSEEYTDYWLDRRLGCRQLGMNLTRRVVMRRLSEVYWGTNPAHRGQLIRTTYFERDFMVGIATDKIPWEKYSAPGYALALARLLGKAAASSLIVGRSLELGISPVFDDGDELVYEGEDGLPQQLLVGDHSGAFGEYKLPLETFAAHYARPVNNRERIVPDARLFARSYIEALREQFLHIQGDYRKRRRAFDTLFKHCKYDPAGSFAYRWERILLRLDQTDAATLMDAIRKHINVLQVPEAAAPIAAESKPASS